MKDLRLSEVGRHTPYVWTTPFHNSPAKKMEGRSFAFCLLAFALTGKFIYLVAVIAAFFSLDLGLHFWLPRRTQDLQLSRDPPDCQCQIGVAEVPSFMA